MSREFGRILSGFFLGQGAMFLTQTWLLYKEQLPLIGAVGIGLGVVSLMQWSADLGGVYIISRNWGRENGLRQFWAHVCARIVFSLVMIVSVLMVIPFLGLNKISNDVILFAMLVPFIWSFNSVGILDNQKINYLSGPLSGLSWLFASLALGYSVVFDLGYVGQLVAIGFSLGMTLTVIVQYLTLRRENIDVEFQVVSVNEVWLALKEGSMFNAGYMGGQLYGRSLPIIVDRFLGGYFSGLYVYAKNMVSMISQLIAFSRRVEFFELLDTRRRLAAIDVVRKQKLGFFIVGLAILFCGSINLVFASIGAPKYEEVSAVAFFLMLVLLVWTVSSAYAQVAIAEHRVGLVGMVIVGTGLGSICLMIVGIEEFGIMAVYLCEAFMYIIQVVLYWCFLRGLGARRLT